MDLMKAEISVIVPVYNVDPYLRRCFDRIIAQSMKQIEIIAVDDGSSDGSGKICDEYAKKDERIMVIHQENGGLSFARNEGLKHASGKYVMFVDSDDYAEADFCRIPYEKAEKEDADIVMFKNSYIRGDQCYRDTKVRYKDGVKTIQEALDIALKHTGVAVWNKLFKRSLFDGITFPEGQYYEDCVVTYQLILKSEKTCFINDMLYVYCYRESSITQERNDQKRSDYISAYHKMFSDLKNLSYRCYIRPDVLRCCLRYLYTHGKKSELADRADELVTAFDDIGMLTDREKLILRIYLDKKLLFHMVHFLIRIMHIA